VDPELAHLERAGAEKAAAAVLPAAAAAWTAAEVMRLAGVHAVFPLGGATALAAALAWGAAGRRDEVPDSLPWWVAVAGGWLTAADALGPLAWWPAPVLTVAWAVFAVAASRAAHRHEAVASAREWREARADWLGRSHDWGLGGSHLLAFERTRLGELYTVDVKGTGKRRSQILASGIAEVIAQAEDLDENRVRLMKHGPAGRIRISVRRTDPWADPILHPVVCDGHEIELPERRSIADPAVIGQDPETGDPLTVPLYVREFGTNRVSIVANSGGGKGVFEDDLFEHVTACADALAVHLNLSVKGYEDEESWGPACWLTAYGPAQKSRAAAVLKIIGELIEWRTKNFKRGQYVPSPEHPAIIIFCDESDAGLSALREDINTMATKGRSHGVGFVRLGQRNTREYADPKARSQDNVRCTGLVQNANEARHAGSGNGPDMSTYGEGKPGVWKIEILGGVMSLGRTWIFHRTAAGHGAAVERIAAERAFAQRELSGACREYLGETLETLLATEVFAKWARGRGAGGYVPEADGEPEADGQLPAAPAPAQDGRDGQEAAAVPGSVATAEDDPFAALERDMDKETRGRFAELNAKLGGVRQMNAETAAMPKPPEASPEVRAAFVAEQWRQVDEQAQIPPEVVAPLMEMLEAGTTAPAVARRFGVSKWTARTWLENLRGRNVAYVAGERSKARWLLAPPPEEAGTP
jgi:hypothetical protein